MSRQFHEHLIAAEDTSEPLTQKLHLRIRQIFGRLDLLVSSIRTPHTRPSTQVQRWTYRCAPDPAVCVGGGVILRADVADLIPGDVN